MSTSSPQAGRYAGWRVAAGWAWRLAVLISVLVVTAGLLFLTGVAGERFGWLTAPVLLGGGGGALAWMLFMRHPRRWPVSLAVVAVGFAFGVELRMTTPMMPSQLAVAISSVELPPGTRFVGAQEFGNPVCFSVCPFLVHSYEVPGTRKEVERSLAEAFRSAGWSVDPEEPTVFVAYNEDAAIAAWVRVGDQYAVNQEQQDGYRVEVEVGEPATVHPQGEPPDRRTRASTPRILAGQGIFASQPTPTVTPLGEESGLVVKYLGGV